MKLSCHLVLLVAAACAVTSTAAEQLIDLGGACEYAVLAKSGISTVPSSVITGDIGVSPIAATAMTGFSLSADSSNQFSTSTQVDGQCHAASYGAPVSVTLTAAVSAMEAAYTAGNNRLATYPLNRGGGTVGGLKFYSGVYKFTSVISIDQDITFDAQGDPNAVFIVTTTQQLLLAVGKKVLLAGDARAENIFWHVAGYVSLGVSSHMEGNLLCYTKIDMLTGSTLNGRALAQTAVNLQMATINKPVGCGVEGADDPLFSSCTAEAAAPAPATAITASPP
jgi:hypothetical protein